MIRGGNGLQRILEPASGAILAIDPDIPLANQRIWFRAANLASQEARRVRWSVDGTVIAQGGEAPWLPRPGRHVVRLLDDRGKVLDRSEEHTSELQSLMRISYAVFCLKKKKK